MVKYIVNNLKVTEYASMQEFLNDLDKVKGKRLIEVIEEQKREDKLNNANNYIAASINTMSEDLLYLMSLQRA